MEVTATDSPSASRIGVQRFRADRNRNQLKRAPGADFRETIHGSGPAGTDAEGALESEATNEWARVLPPASRQVRQKHTALDSELPLLFRS